MRIHNNLSPCAGKIRNINLFFRCKNIYDASKSLLKLHLDLKTFTFCFADSLTFDLPASCSRLHLSSPSWLWVCISNCRLAARWTTEMFYIVQRHGCSGESMVKNFPSSLFVLTVFWFSDSCSELKKLLSTHYSAADTQTPRPQVCGYFQKQFSVSKKRRKVYKNAGFQITSPWLTFVFRQE